MKKLTGILCILGLLIATSSFTRPIDDAVSSKVKSAFEKTFMASSDVFWEKLDGYYIVTFKVDTQSFSAAYNEDGDLISASRYISFSQLPLNITLALENKYQGYTYQETVTELTSGGLTSYYIKGENKKNYVTIKATSSGDLSIESKTKK